MRDAKEKRVTVIDEDGLFDLIRSRSQLQLESKVATDAVGGGATTEKKRRGLYNRNHQQQIQLLAQRNDLVPHSTDAAVTAKSDGTALWIDKWKPRSTEEIIGNTSNIQQIKSYLLRVKQWYTNHARGDSGGGGVKDSEVKSKKNSKHEKTKVRSSGDEFPRETFLIGGAPGTGKTTACHLCARECGFDILEMNASDVRSRNSIEEEIGTAVHNYSILGFLQSSKRAGKTEGKADGEAEKKQHEKRMLCIIMDEVDGVNAGDRGGIQEIIRRIKTTKNPILCICNDTNDAKIRTLKSHCTYLTWRRPTVQQIMNRMQNILRCEDLRLEPNALEQLIASTHQDIRQVLNLLQMWHQRHVGACANNSAVTYDQVTASISQGVKDFDIDTFSVLHELLRPPPSQTHVGLSGHSRRPWIVERSD
uniref:Replication factor C subunit 1 n=1 Tax=Lygus hesperus TaxID=30085 RepID=A0A0A9W3C7_LYGHE